MPAMISMPAVEAGFMRGLRLSFSFSLSCLRRNVQTEKTKTPPARAAGVWKV